MLTAAFQPPDQPTADDQQNRNQLCSRHHSAENFAAPGIVAQKFDEVTLDAVQDHEAAPNLSVELLAPEQPHQQQKIEKLSRGFDQLRRLNPDAGRSPANSIRQRIREDDAPEGMGRFAITAASRKTTKASRDGPKSRPGPEAIAGAPPRLVMPPHVPGRNDERGITCRCCAP